MSGQLVDDSALANLAHFPKLREIWLANTGLTDGRLRQLGILPNLERLMITDEVFGTAVTNQGLVFLHDKFPQLKEASIEGNCICGGNLLIGNP